MVTCGSCRPRTAATSPAVSYIVPLLSSPHEVGAVCPRVFQQPASSREGAILDATLDRYTDFLIIGALTYLTVVVLDRYPDLLIGHLSFLTSEAALILGLVALLGAMMTPYVKAKTEAEGKSSTATIGDRGVRNHILVLGLLASQPIWTLVALAVLANWVAIHRLARALRRE